MTRHPIHMLWAVPRTTSTAFEWMMRMRGDMTCFHEPFGEAWYKGDNARWPRLADDSPRIPGMTFAGQLDEVLAAADERPVFVKDFPTYVAHMITDEFLELFEHSFLIRDPAKVLASTHKQWDWFVADEIGFDHQRNLFDRLTERNGSPPPLIDSDDLLTDPATVVERWCNAIGIPFDDLLTDPATVVERWCNAIGIPFIAEALSWDPGARDEVLWYGGGWHDSLKGSDGLKPQPTSTADLSGKPEWLLEMHVEGRRHYDHLHRHRISAH